MVAGSELVTAARAHLGVPYLWGGKTAAGLDCSGHVYLSMRDVGLTFPVGTSLTQIDLCEPIDVDAAREIPGAVLYRPGHIAISTGESTVIDALTTGVTESAWTDTYNGQPRFTRAGLLPGIDYTTPDVEETTGMVTITSSYGWRTFTLNGKRLTTFHRGNDVRSPNGANVISLFDGEVVRTASGRLPGAGIGVVSNGKQPLASSLSGNGVIVRVGNGYYVEAHMAPSVKVGDKVTAGATVLGKTDLSGSITGAHRHIEMWKSLDPGSYYDPTAAIKAAAAAIDKKDWFDMATEAQLKKIVTDVVADALKGLPKSVWGYRNPNVETKRDAYQILRDASADAAAARKG